MATVSLDTSPMKLLSALRGTIVAARIAYPEVLHLEVQDAEGGLWRLATQDARWTPPNPGELTGRVVRGAEIDASASTLRLDLADGFLDVVAEPSEARDDPPNWELITPRGELLEFGPGPRWQISSAVVEHEPAVFATLTARERATLRLLADGLSDADIGDRLSLPAAAVALARARAIKKLRDRDPDESNPDSVHGPAVG